MFLKYFTAPETLNYEIEDIFDEGLVSFISPIMHYTSIITIAFSFILITVIIFKTPKQMRFFKAYLLPYVLNTLFLEIVMLLFKPLLLHPFFALVSLEMPQTGAPKTLLILFIFMAYFAMALVDCIASMASERYFALSDLSQKHRRKPIIIFGVLSILTLCFLIFAIILVCIDPIRHAFIMSAAEADTFLSAHMKGYSKMFNVRSILVFRPDISLSSFAIGFTLFVIFVFSRYLIAMVFFGLSAYISHTSMMGMSRALQKHNAMLLRCTYAQFGTFCALAGTPAVIIVITYYFISEPSKIIYFCFLFMNMFGLFDILITIFCIKPYRNFFLDILTLKYFSKLPSPYRNNSIYPISTVKY